MILCFLLHLALFVLSQTVVESVCFSCYSGGVSERCRDGCNERNKYRNYKPFWIEVWVIVEVDNFIAQNTAIL